MRAEQRDRGSRSTKGGSGSRTRIALAAFAALLIVSSSATAAPRIGSKDIKRDAVRSKQIKNGAVRHQEIEKDAIRAQELDNDTVETRHLAERAVRAENVGSNGIQLRVSGACPAGQAIRIVEESGAVGCQTVGGGGAPSGPAGGDLAGTYPNPQVANGSVELNDLANGSVDSATVVNDSLTGADIDESTLSGLWFTGGNGGTSAGRDFLGTTDDQPLEFRVNDSRALRLEPATDGTNESPNVIGGIADNAVTAGVHSATIGGGGGLITLFDEPNRVTDDGGTVGGGAGNQAGDDAGSTSDRIGATVAGGRANMASGTRATVAGGNNNDASGSYSAVGGGNNNDASGFQSVVAGGSNNTASNLGATVPGGASNEATGVNSLAAGSNAQAHHAGAFVWADTTNADMASTADDQFIARASGDFFLQSDSSLDDQGGFLNTSTGAFLSNGGTWTNASDANLKEGFEEVEPERVLAEVAELPVRSWSYEAEPGVRHLGPTAQDFHAAFGLGADDRHIASVDADGVALAAIQGLAERNRELGRELGEERRYRAELELRIDALERITARSTRSRHFGAAHQKGQGGTE